MRHFLSTLDCSAREIEALLDTAVGLKAGRLCPRLEGKVMGMVFFNPSLRTRVSFESGMFQLGGHALHLAVGGGDLWTLEVADGVVMDGQAAEHVKEAVPVLARYVDVLGVRCFPRGSSWESDRLDPVLSAFARYSTVPVINMESSLWHPCQALADAMTWREIGLRKKDPIVLTWAWHPKALPTAVPHSVVAMAAQQGLSVTVLRPPPFALDADVMDRARKAAEASGGSVRETDDVAALEGARVVYAKSWGSLLAYGKPEEERALRDPYRSWQVTPEWMARTDRARFMHCLPVRRNVVVADAVLDSASSVVVDQAENRLHAQKALLLRLLGAGGPPGKEEA